MHVFSSGGACARPKPSPRGEDAELCSPDEVERSRLPPAVPVSRRVPVPRHKPSPRGEGGELYSPDAVEASRPLRRRRSRAASCVISCFQSSMLLHNLSSVFFSRKESPPARPAQLPRPAPHDRHSAPSRKSTPRRSPASRHAPRHSPANRPAPRHSPASRPAPHRSPASRPAPRRSPASRPAPHRSPASRPTPRHSPASLPSAGPIPRCGRFSTDFPQSFPHFCRFPTAAFFPLGFLGERQRQIF